jgi:hypothetical protein
VEIAAGLQDFPRALWRTAHWVKCGGCSSQGQKASGGGVMELAQSSMEFSFGVHLRGRGSDALRKRHTLPTLTALLQL